MTSRPVPTSTPSSTPGPGDRPHLPPVAASSTADRRRRKAPLAWLPWALLGLLLLTLLGAALLAKAAGGGDTAARTTSDSAQAGSSSTQGGDAPDAALSAGGQDLLALRDGSVGSLDGARVSGTAKVQSVVADEGFWVGASAADRVFVFLTPQARQSAGESGFQVEAGQTVALEGTVKPSSAEFAQAAGVTDDEGSRQLVQQGGYVEATEVRLAP